VRFAIALAAALAALAALTASAAEAAWAPGATGGAAARARTMPTPDAPSASAALLGRVNLSWTAVGFSGGPSVAGYVIRRYTPAGVEEAVGGTCTGVVTGTSCQDSGAPIAQQRLYAVTAAQGAWRGPESPRTSVTVL
jgi:hypothetical protein